MTNGNILRELREMAERQNLSTKTALPMVFTALAEILDEQVRQREEAHIYREGLERNPMIQLGELISRKPKTVAIVTVLVLVAINAAGPLILEIISKIP